MSRSTYCTVLTQLQLRIEVFILQCIFTEGLYVRAPKCPDPRRKENNVQYAQNYIHKLYTFQDSGIHGGDDLGGTEKDLERKTQGHL